ncbi:MAG: hypothetical protein CMJ78_27420 [Planctomycetaceae bacterium]|nr:hypothetical protein [Planctomycetaceae bacterium]
MEESRLVVRQFDGKSTETDGIRVFPLVIGHWSLGLGTWDLVILSPKTQRSVANKVDIPYSHRSSMDTEIVYYIVAALLLLLNCVSWIATLFTLPGNWVIVLLTTLFAIFIPTGEGQGISWWGVGAVIVLAIIGEIVELLAGAAGAAKQGASRRAMVLAVIGAMIGSLIGAIFCSAIPVIGTIIGAVGGACGGSFGGAYLGELWKGRERKERLNISSAAMLGRLLGTMGKLMVGAVMVAVAAIDSFV